MRRTIIAAIIISGVLLFGAGVASAGDVIQFPDRSTGDEQAAQLAEQMAKTLGEQAWQQQTELNRQQLQGEYPR